MHLIFAKTISECPVCESSSVRRFKRKGFVERICFRLAFVWPYRCKDCDSRFWCFRRSYHALRHRSGLAIARGELRSGASHG